ncbi:MAG: tetratricopeptide repeat protein [Polyangia bacterium]|jgi:TolA-binding protein|nr:tetratricopeptide repeat protein [Polyangia bacterium]
MNRRSACIASLLAGLLLSGPALAQRSVSSLEGDVQTIEGQIAQYLSVIKPPSAQVSSRELGRRLVDGMVLYRMKDYSRASIVLLDIVSRYPGTPAASEAAFYLADSLFQQREFVVARTHFERVVNDGSSNPYYQLALQRLLELEMRRAAVLGRAKTADRERLKQVETLLRKIEAIPRNQREPSVEYVRGKYLFFLDKVDEAFRVFAGLGAKHPYHLHAVYFLGVCHIQKSRLSAAYAVYQQFIERVLTEQQPIRTDRERLLLQLIILAGARVAYVLGQPKDIESSIQLYNAIPTKSPYYADSLYERAWAYLKAKRYEQATAALELLKIVNPHFSKADEARVLLGNLKVHTQDFDGAKEVFRGAANSLRPVFRKLSGLQGAGIDPKIIYAQLVTQDPDRFDIEVRLPPLALKWLRQQPPVKRGLLMLDDLESVKNMIRGCEGLIREIQRAIGGGSLISRFPPLAVARARAADFETQLVRLRSDLSDHLRQLVGPLASGDERARLESVRKRHEALVGKLRELPSSSDAYQVRVQKMRELFDRVDSNALVVELEAKNLEAMLRAIESYYYLTLRNQSIPKNVMDLNLKTLREQIGSIQARIRSLREDVADSRSTVGIDDAVMRQERQLRSQLASVLALERQLSASIASRMRSGQRARLGRIESLISRIDRAQQNLVRVNQRIDNILEAKKAEVASILAEEKAKLVGYRSQLALYQPSSEEVVGGVVLRSFKQVAAMVQSVLVRADVGVLDVVWAIKSLTTDQRDQQEGRYMKEMEALKSKYREPRGEP